MNRLLIVAVLLTGCGAAGPGLRVDYRDVIVDVDAKGTARVAIAVHDRRARVLEQGKSADFVGSSNTAAGIPSIVRTKTGRALADDVATAISKSLRLRGFVCEIVRTRAQTGEVAVRRALIAKAADRIVLLTLRTWETHTLVRTELRADVDLAVLDGKGNRLALETLAENPIVSDDPTDIPVVSERAYRVRLERLLNLPTIRAALESTGG